MASSSKKKEKASGEGSDGVKNGTKMMGETKKHCNYGGKNPALVAQLNEYKRLQAEAEKKRDEANKFLQIVTKLAKINTST
ncbi:hypothetical protein FH972_012645 [Carpinus fangiana]|uniref:Uncharacterized protein n=1 Tax=Carpinus fangiana TaxID=176857 RepID=A0A5N6R7S8_9ROSI|nr:hypothetical protein FH972_012645 [Carpinus fangiana]